MTSRLTILIVARDAEATIARAIRSTRWDAGGRLVLVDDHSEDRTVAHAKEAAGSLLRVLRAPNPGGVSRARQCALDAVDTEYAAWLDADDEWLPGRADRLVSALARGADVVSDGIELRDGPSQALLRTLIAPAYIRRPGGILRLFERNVLPGDTQVGFRTEAFRQAGGYDPAICGPESYDVLLRATRQGCRLAFLDETGYRMHAYPTSLSRNVERQTDMLARVLRKHEYEDVRRLYLDAGLGDRLARWALIIVAVSRREPEAALWYLQDVERHSESPDVVLDPDGPWPMPEGWRVDFYRGVALLMLGARDDEAVEALRRAEQQFPSAEGANNLGVAFARLGRPEEARMCYAQALERFPGYADAAVNAAMKGGRRVTAHPLRRQPARADYPLAQRT